MHPAHKLVSGINEKPIMIKFVQEDPVTKYVSQQSKL